MGPMDEQSELAGQHSADEELSNDMQAWFDAHLKVSGKLGSTVLQFG